MSPQLARETHVGLSQTPALGGELSCIDSSRVYITAKSSPMIRTRSPTYRFSFTAVEGAIEIALTPSTRWPAAARI
jgi:hypothetical protein